MEKVYTLDKKMSKKEIKEFMNFVSITADETRKKNKGVNNNQSSVSKKKRFKIIETPDIAIL
ncbi:MULTISPECIES: hypothetical protein [unclassified Gemella]|uniref:hypothetical protein n=1 Tax=unclassified Gemella TaxID=2624949 RepID=UPI00107444CD|nr:MULTISPECIES: hypothetical protein [unclassified Gemella]MBF0709735.1 hypothetical protein [Gemella sp. GL1.1]MBF0747252.1 hypothetical protein [Gemella sp. 19428wG2_WT2a]NYS27079.1 hypothetical protein [Gemella sp. GL1]TFU57838.1 hypothetical protein E4T67_06235 [Gemella sp. WT2a]